MKTAKFWPLYPDQEVPVYETLAWDLPGLKPKKTRKSPRIGSNER